MLTIERFQNGKLIDGIAIWSKEAKVTHVPIPALNNTVMVSFSFPEVKILRGKVKKHQVSWGDFL